MKTLLYFIFFTLATYSCNQPGCNKNENEILSTKDKNTFTYQRELMRLIEEHHSEVEYFFEGRAEMKGESYIIMNCYGPGFCGELKTKFVHKNVESIKLQNEGWKGAQLIGVGFKRVILESGYEIFAFEKLDKIID